MNEVNSGTEEKWKAYREMQEARKERMGLVPSNADQYMLGLVIEGGIETNAELVEKTHDELLNFFGREVSVPPPTWVFNEARKRLGDNGVTIFDPIYFPDVLLHPEAHYPGWKVKPSDSFFRRAAWQPNKSYAYTQGRNGLTTLPGVWGLIDKSKRPDYENGQQLFPDDPFGRLLSDFREYTPHPQRMTLPVAKDSRFGIPSDLLHRFVFKPQLLRWGLYRFIQEGKLTMQLPTMMEFNFAANLRYPHFGESDTSELLADVYAVEEYQTMHEVVKVQGYLGISGNRERGGLHQLDIPHLEKVPLDRIAFRPVIKFYE